MPRDHSHGKRSPGGASHFVVIPVRDLAGHLLEGTGGGGVLHVELSPVVVIVELRKVGTELPNHPNPPKMGRKGPPLTSTGVKGTLQRFWMELSSQDLSYFLP